MNITDKSLEAYPFGSPYLWVISADCPFQVGFLSIESKHLRIQLNLKAGPFSVLQETTRSMFEEYGSKRIPLLTFQTKLSKCTLYSVPLVVSQISGVRWNGISR